MAVEQHDVNRSIMQHRARPRAARYRGYGAVVGFRCRYVVVECCRRLVNTGRVMHRTFTCTDVTRE